MLSFDYAIKRLNIKIRVMDIRLTYVQIWIFLVSLGIKSA